MEDTIQIVEKNPSKFRIDANELKNRKQFIQLTRDEVNVMKTRAQNQNPTQNGKYSEVSHESTFNLVTLLKNNKVH